MSLGGQNLTDEDIRRYIAMQSAVPAGPAPTPYSDPTLMAQQAILARPMRPSFTGQPLMSREVPTGAQQNSGLAYPSMQSSGLLNMPPYTSRYVGTDTGETQGSSAPNTGWSNMTPSQQAAYYAENPNMATATRAAQTVFGWTMPGMMQNSLMPGFVRDQGLIALGIDPGIAVTQEMGRQNAQEGFRAAEYGLMNEFSPSYGIDVSNSDASQSISDQNTAGDGGGYGGYSDSAGSDSFGGGEY